MTKMLLYQQVIEIFLKLLDSFCSFSHSIENIHFFSCKYILDIDNFQSTEEILFVPETKNHSLYRILHKFISQVCWYFNHLKFLFSFFVTLFFFQFDLVKPSHWNNSIENALNELENSKYRNELIELFTKNKKD